MTVLTYLYKLCTEKSRKLNNESNNTPNESGNLQQYSLYIYVYLYIWNQESHIMKLEAVGERQATALEPTST